MQAEAVVQPASGYHTTSTKKEVITEVSKILSHFI